MNIQVSMPYEKCPFNCPMCVANGRKVFDNLYDKDQEKYLQTILNTANTGMYGDFIITGAADPTLNQHWLHDILYILKDVNTELQTKNYNINPDKLPHLNTLAYSITNSKEYLAAHRYPRLTKGNNRIVILLTKEFSFLTKENFDTMNYDQITFKVLQGTADEKTNKWIEENKLEDLSNIYDIVNKFNGSNVSVRLDSNCQDSHGRYKIYRADGKFYSSWEEE